MYDFRGFKKEKGLNRIITVIMGFLSSSRGEN